MLVNLFVNRRRRDGTSTASDIEAGVTDDATADGNDIDDDAVVATVGGNE